jgi:hypothetical protein
MTTSETSAAPDSDDEQPVNRRRSERPPRAKTTPLQRLRKKARRKARELGHKAEEYPTVLFVAALLLLDAVLNARYPSREPVLWYLVPSLDVVVLLVILAVVGQLKGRVPKPVRIGLVVWLVFVRLLRLADGIQDHYFSEQFNLYADLPLAQELVRFVHSALPWWLFALSVLGALATLAAMSFGLYFGLSHVERYLRKRRQLYIAATLVGGLFVASALIGHKPQYDEYFQGSLGASVMPRLKHEADFLYNIYSEKGEHSRAMAKAERRIRQLPTNLAKLRGRSVYLIFVESYGDCVFTWARHEEPSRAVFDRFHAELLAQGFSMVSGALDSPTYGGRSWLAHSTIATGIKVKSQLEYELVTTRKPKTLARFFRDAGYSTVLVQPGTTRAWPKGEFYDFEKKYYLWNFDYAGPSYSWATMPDQYVLDFIQRREMKKTDRPQFIQFVLVTSHAPWSELPPVIDDWDSIQNGAIYNRLKKQLFPVSWPNFENAQEPYIRSIIYDFEVLRRFIPRAIDDDSLVILLGDHQPVSDVTGESESWGVPVHVLSRDKELLKPFEARGYVPGIRPPLEGARAGLESFLGDFLADFSTWDAQGSLN